MPSVIYFLRDLLKGLVSSRLMSLLLSQIYCLTLFLLGYMYTKILVCYFSDAHVERDLESMVGEPLNEAVLHNMIQTF